MTVVRLQDAVLLALPRSISCSAPFLWPRPRALRAGGGRARVASCRVVDLYGGDFFPPCSRDLVGGTVRRWRACSSRRARLSTGRPVRACVAGWLSSCPVGRRLAALFVAGFAGRCRQRVLQTGESGGVSATRLLGHAALTLAW